MYSVEILDLDYIANIKHIVGIGGQNDIFNVTLSNFINVLLHAYWIFSVS